ncbi:hypothetical protein D3C75_1047070 [compost metagenome]
MPTYHLDLGWYPEIHRPESVDNAHEQRSQNADLVRLAKPLQGYEFVVQKWFHPFAVTLEVNVF